MEAYTFVHKETKDFIRYMTCFVNREYNKVYFFTDYKDYHIWFVETLEEAEFAYNKNAQY